MKYDVVAYIKATYYPFVTLKDFSTFSRVFKHD